MVTGGSTGSGFWPFSMEESTSTITSDSAKPFSRSPTSKFKLFLWGAIFPGSSG